MKDKHLNKDFSASADLISTTNPQSDITYANDVFCDIAGYSYDELVGQPHNMVRHPDMPKSAFKQLWTYLKSGQSWMGLVKNRCKDGKHYWVSAFATPIKDASGNIIEYQSVRSRAEPEQIERAEKLYEALNNGQKTSRIRMKFHTVAITLSSIMLLLAALATIQAPSPFNIALIAVSLLSIACSFFQFKRFTVIRDLASEAYTNTLMEHPYTNHFDDFSQIELALIMRKAQIRAVTGRASDTTKDIHAASEEELKTCEQIGRSLDQQCHETDQVAAAVEELTHSINEVADAASAASKLAEQAGEESTKGLDSIHSTIDEVNLMAETLAHAQTIINQLSKDTQQIDSILEVITAISEQTNLLALNAAIEAARAGEAGRGFAVVADEVRNLASKTGSSASEIHTMIRQLQSTAENAVGAMAQGIDISDGCKERAAQTGDVLNTISEKLNLVTDSSIQIAAAVEQQANVTQEINRNVTNTKTLADDTSEISRTSVIRIQNLVDRLEGLDRLMKQFKA